jgi:hypothetical protein
MHSKKIQRFRYVATAAKLFSTTKKELGQIKLLIRTLKTIY